MAISDDKSLLSRCGVDFIDDEKLHGLMGRKTDEVEVREVIAKSMRKEPLTVDETAVLIAADKPELVEEIFDAARQLKRDVYGNRIVLFAPLYVGNLCVNDCHYCAFRRSNKDAVRRTLSEGEMAQQVSALIDKGHKRLILVFGEHPNYDANYIADCTRKIYEIQRGNGNIRRVNINAAPLDHEGFKIVKDAGIGTYQIFQETYHKPTYAKMHPGNTRKGDFLWRLDGVARSIEVGADDVGIGALFGLYDWRFEVLSLIEHSHHLFNEYGIGPHTLSFPRLRPASGVSLDETHFVNDYDFKRLVAILRLAVPYAGMILTAREPAELRREILSFGVSQIDAGSRIEIGGYTEAGDAQVMEREQFQLGDVRSLDEVMLQLMEDDYVPSFCTACYRLGRTGERFMEFAIPGFIQDFCTPNALTTLEEYLVDYAESSTKEVGFKLIERELDKIPEGTMKSQVIERLQKIRETDERDLYF